MDRVLERFRQIYTLKLVHTAYKSFYTNEKEKHTFVRSNNRKLPRVKYFHIIYDENHSAVLSSRVYANICLRCFANTPAEKYFVAYEKARKMFQMPARSGSKYTLAYILTIQTGLGPNWILACLQL